VAFLKKQKKGNPRTPFFLFTTLCSTDFRLQLIKISNNHALIFSDTFLNSIVEL